MNTEMLEARMLRKKFIGLFVAGMKERVNYKFQFTFFYFLFAVLPLFTVIMVILLSMGVVAKSALLLVFFAHAIMYLYSIISLIVEDMSEMPSCLWEIHYDHPELAKALRMTSDEQWEDDSLFCKV